MSNASPSPCELVLVKIGGETWSGVGSRNGGEVSYRLSCEAVLLVDQSEICARLVDVSAWNWPGAQTDSGMM